MRNMTGDSALICSVNCLAHTSPHVGASVSLPATPISPFNHEPPPPASNPYFHPATSNSPKCCVVHSLHPEEEVGTGLWSKAATTTITSEG